MLIPPKYSQPTRQAANTNSIDTAEADRAENTEIPGLPASDLSPLQPFELDDSFQRFDGGIPHGLEAEDLCTRAEALKDKGNALFKLGDTEAAAEVFIKVLRALEPPPAVGERRPRVCSHSLCLGFSLLALLYSRVSHCLSIYETESRYLVIGRMVNEIVARADRVGCTMLLVGDRTILLRKLLGETVNPRRLPVENHTRRWNSLDGSGLLAGIAVPRLGCRSKVQHSYWRWIAQQKCLAP